MSLQAAGTGPSVYQLAVREVARHLRPARRGSRWSTAYESVDTRRPLTTVAEGEVVRVRLRITVRNQGMVVLDDPLPAPRRWT